MKRRAGAYVAVLAAAAAVLLGGCGKMVKPDRENGYATSYAMSAVEYAIFMSEETAVLENVLTTRLSMANSVLNGTYEAAKEAENASEALSKIESLKTAVMTTMPAQGYESDRDALLNCIEDARLVMENYESALTDGRTSDLKSIAEEMKAAYLAASGEANVFYE